jgi:hypothetical protein
VQTKTKSQSFKVVMSSLILEIFFTDCDTPIKSYLPSFSKPLKIDPPINPKPKTPIFI